MRLLRVEDFGKTIPVSESMQRLTMKTMTAASLQHRSFPPCLQFSSPSSSSSSSSSSSFWLSSRSQNVTLRARCIVSPSPRGWVLSRSHQSVTLQFPGQSRSPAVVGSIRAVASRGGGSEEEDELALYEEELGQEDENRNPNGNAKVSRTFRLLGNKEKKELRAYAHQLGNDICVHQVGKWGLSANCITAISDALEANELVKIRVLDNLDEELDDTASQLEGKTGAQIVGKMGRTLLLYRPSMRKLQAAQAAELKAYRYQQRKTTLASRARSSSRSFPGASRGKR